MTRARASNFINPTPPTPAPTAAPRINIGNGLDRSAYLAWDYTAADADSVTYFQIAVKLSGKPDVLRYVEVPTPNTDVIVDRLENGTEYAFLIRAANGTGFGPAATAKATPKPPVIAAPELLTIAPGDGLAKATYRPPASLPDGYTLRHIAFQATNTDTGQITDGKTTGTPEAAVIPELDNDTNYRVQLVAVADPGPVLSALSNSLDVRPTKPIVPYPPVILDAYATEGGVLTVKWAPEDQPNGGNTGPLDITAWRVRAHSSDGKGADFSQEFPGEARTWAEKKLTMGYWEIFVQAKNDVGWSMDSKPVVVFYSYNYSPPLTGGGTVWETQTYNFLWCKADAKLQRTAKGANWPIRVALAGAGGGGKRQTLTGGKGGNGGGGELVIVELPPPGTAGDVVVKVGRGADENSGDNPADTTVSEGANTYVARSGKTATSKDDAAGFGPATLPPAWRDANAFMWNVPYSYTVGGVTTDGTPQFPNGYGPGQGGAGVKVNHAGNGEDGLVCFMWRKDGKPFDDPLGAEARKSRRWWRW